MPRQEKATGRGRARTLGPSGQSALSVASISGVGNAEARLQPGAVPAESAQAHLKRTLSIRTRLFIAFALVVLIPVAATGVGGFLGGGQSDRENALNRLEAVASLKEAEIERWTETLQTELANALNAMDRTHASTLLGEESPALIRSAARRELRDQLRLPIAQRPHFEQLSLMDLQGEVVVSSDAAQEGKVYNGITFFEHGKAGPYMNPAYYSTSLGHIAVVVARPVVSDQGQTVGVLVGHAGLERLNELMLERSGLGETGETYLVGADYTLLTALRYGETGGQIHTQGTETAIEKHAHGSGLYEGYQGLPVVGSYHWLPGIQAALLVEQAQAEALASTRESLRIIGGIALLSFSVAGVTAWLATRGIANPLKDMVEDANRIAAGDLAHRVTALHQHSTVRRNVARRGDELGSLARAFNRMTEQWRDLISGLETRVADRTRELERRSAHLKASADVGRTVSSILDAEELIQQSVELIREQFDLYYVGLFLLDAAGKWAVLRAGTGDTGRMMLAQSYRIRVGEGMIGLSIARAQARVALEAGGRKQEAEGTKQRFGSAEQVATSELPETRSNGRLLSAAALPLRSRGQVMGALSVQSDQPDAFAEDAMVVLQTVADLVAVALDNAYLFAESQEALEASIRAYGESGREAWGKLLNAEPNLGYRSSIGGITNAGDVWRPEMEDALQRGETIQWTQTIRGNGVDAEVDTADIDRASADIDRASADIDRASADIADVDRASVRVSADIMPAGCRRFDADDEQPLAVPIKVRGEVIGVLDTYKRADAGKWTTDEIALLEALAGQLGIAVEGARLYEEAQRRAMREQLTREITDTMRRATDVEAIIQTAVDELFEILGTSRAFVHLGASPPAQGHGAASLPSTEQGKDGCDR